MGGPARFPVQPRSLNSHSGCECRAAGHPIRRPSSFSGRKISVTYVRILAWRLLQIPSRNSINTFARSYFEGCSGPEQMLESQLLVEANRGLGLRVRFQISPHARPSRQVDRESANSRSLRPIPSPRSALPLPSSWPAPISPGAITSSAQQPTASPFRSAMRICPPEPRICAFADRSASGGLLPQA